MTDETIFAGRPGKGRPGRTGRLPGRSLRRRPGAPPAPGRAAGGARQARPISSNARRSPLDPDHDATQALTGTPAPWRGGRTDHRRRATAPPTTSRSDVPGPAHPPRFARPDRPLRGARRSSAGAASASSSGRSTRCCSAWSPSRCWPRSWPPPRRPASGFCARPGRPPRSGTRTSSRSTPSRSNRCRTW